MDYSLHLFMSIANQGLDQFIATSYKISQFADNSIHYGKTRSPNVYLTKPFHTILILDIAAKINSTFKTKLKISKTGCPPSEIKFTANMFTSHSRRCVQMFIDKLFASKADKSNNLTAILRVYCSD